MKHTGDSYFDDPSFRRMLENYEDEMAQNRPIFMDIDELADIADYYNLIGEYEKAMQATEISIQLHPGAVYPLVFKAHEALNRNDVAQARHFAAAIIDKEDIEYKYLVAEILIAEGDTLQADIYLENTYRATAAEDNDNVCIDCANLFLDYSHTDLSSKWLQRCHDHHSVSYKETSGKILYVQKNYKKSIEIFRELIDVNPYDARYWKILAEAHFYNYEMDEAIQCIDYAIAINPNDKDCYGLRGDCHNYLEDYTEAAKYYKRYYEADQSNIDLNLSYAIALIHTKQCNEALDVLKHIEEALDSSQNQGQSVYTVSEERTIQLYIDLALAYTEMGDEGMVLRCLKHATSNKCTPQQLVAQGRIMLCFNHIDKAKELFVKAMYQEKENEKPLLSMHIAVSLFDNGYIEQCYKILKKSLSLYKEPIIDTWPYLALCCIELHRNEEFLYFLKEAVEKAPLQTQQLLKDLFPVGTEVDEYYDYMYNKINNKL